MTTVNGIEINDPVAAGLAYLLAISGQIIIIAALVILLVLITKHV